MKHMTFSQLRLMGLGIIVNVFCSASCAIQQGPPTLDRSLLNKHLALLQSGNQDIQQAVDDLLVEADSVAKVGNLNVVSKKQVPPSGDKHDYLSVGQYWWPDPSKPDGLPYIRKDGKTNPEFYQIKDNMNMIEMARNLRILGVAFYFSKDEKYAAKAISQMREWFLNPDTRMNPNFDYAQYIPGINDGRAEGTIDARSLVDALDGITLLRQSTNWTIDDEKGIMEWFNTFLNWMQTSKNGVTASKLVNNIGTAYYMQLLSYAVFTGNYSVARQALKGKIPELMEHQFDVDGKQPEELKRTNAWNYSIANLNYWFRIARVAEKLNVDLWNYTTPSGKSILKAYEWMKPYADGEKWPYQQIQKTNFNRQFASLRIRGERKYYGRSNIVSNRTQPFASRTQDRNATSQRNVSGTSDIIRPSAITILTEGY